MKPLLTFLLSIALTLGLNAQSFQNIEPQSVDGLTHYILPSKAKQKTEIFFHPKTLQLRVKNGDNDLLSRKINFSQEVLTTSDKLLYSPKLQCGFLFIEASNEMSLGAKIFLINQNTITELQHLCYAAYTSENGQRMNYNSILPYLSVIRSGNRTLMFFNTNYVVKNPNQNDEQILESKSFYFELSEKGFIEKAY